jgi:hypothetical protein
MGDGLLPPALRASLTVGDDIVFLAEGLTGSVTRSNFRAPGKRAAWERSAVSGAIAITSRRLVVWAGRYKHIDIPLDHPMRAAIEIVADRPDRVVFAYDIGATHPDSSGQVLVRLHTPDAARVVALTAGQ